MGLPAVFLTIWGAGVATGVGTIIGAATESTSSSSSIIQSEEPRELEIGISLHPRKDNPAKKNMLLHVQVIRKGLRRHYYTRENIWRVISSSSHDEELKATAPILQRLLAWEGDVLRGSYMLDKVLPMVDAFLKEHQLSLDTFLPGALRLDARFDNWSGKFKSHARIRSIKEASGAWKLLNPEFDFPLEA